MLVFEKLAQLWSVASAPPDLFLFLEMHVPDSAEELLEILLLDQRKRWESGSPFGFERYLAGIAQFPSGYDWALELAVGEYRCRVATGKTLEIASLVARLPGRENQLLVRLGVPVRSTEPLEEASSAGVYSALSPRDYQADFIDDQDRYRIESVIGEGAFGRIYLAYDSLLQRLVAVKVPTGDRFQKSEDLDLYIKEAQTVARLSHPNIVPVYDSGRTKTNSVFVVSRFIEGMTLAQSLEKGRLPLEQAVDWLVSIAQALHHAHLHGVVHRDIKPENVLIEDSSQSAFIADFGLSVRESDYLSSNSMAGTPAYMSPEMARRETHRVTAASDVFSLGIVFYEMLTGTRPFHGNSISEILGEIISAEPTEIQRLNPSVPAELSRICFKALEKRMADRHESAAHFARDLQQWRRDTELMILLSDTPSASVLCKGLPAFDGDDAAFFLNLLPGVRDRDGVPNNISFWKRRIECCEADKTFSVGLMYGQSGCGKTSLVRAGLIPLLSQELNCIYIEASNQGTEEKLLKRLGDVYPEEVVGRSLPEAMAEIRNGEGGKTIIFLDQFEQWLHVHGSNEDSALLKALRHCDGERLQVVLMLRDDFAMSAARFMRALETPIVQGWNFEAVELFELSHAEKVLTLFGQALGKLPKDSSELLDEQRSFLARVVEELAEGGFVIPVQLSLFCEVARRRPWTLETLSKIGGVQGIGDLFLEETFEGRESNPAHVECGAHAQAVFRALLPPVGSEIRGGRKSLAELREATGLESDSQRFDQLIRILSQDLRLISPSDSEESAIGVESVEKSGALTYQLTHDYLIPALRSWLGKKQRATLSGRAQILLEERTASWRTRKETRHLPSIFEWLRIAVLTRRRHWTVEQRQMMTSSTQYYGVRAGTVSVALLVIAGIYWGTVDSAKRRLDKQLVDSLRRAETSQLLAIARDFDAGDEDLFATLEPLLGRVPTNSEEKRELVKAQIVGVSRDSSLVEPLIQELLSGDVQYVLPILARLRELNVDLDGRFRETLADETFPQGVRMRAAVSLASRGEEGGFVDWQDEIWAFVISSLLSSSAAEFDAFIELLDPVSDRLLSFLITHLRENPEDYESSLRARQIAQEFSSGNVAAISDIMFWIGDDEVVNVLRLLLDQQDQVDRDQLSKIVSTRFDDRVEETEQGDLSRLRQGRSDVASYEWVAHEHRRAKAAALLLELQEFESVLPILELEDDLEALARFNSLIRELNVPFSQIVELKRVAQRTDLLIDNPSSRYSIMMLLGQYDLVDESTGLQSELILEIEQWFLEDPSAMVHSAAGWLLRRWDQEKRVDQIEQRGIEYSPHREWFTIQVPYLLENRLYTSQQSSDGGLQSISTASFSMTFIVVGADEWGATATTLERQFASDMNQAMGYSYAIMDRELTLREFAAFSPPYRERVGMIRDSGLGYVAGSEISWTEAVEVCWRIGEAVGLDKSEQPYLPPKTEVLAPSFSPIGTSVFAQEEGTSSARRDRHGFRLPTVREWELANHGGLGRWYSYGNSERWLGDFGWHYDNSESEMHPTRLLCPNPRGLFDSHGNVAEWTDDWHKESVVIQDASAVRRFGSFRKIYVGGSYESDIDECRLSMVRAADAEIPGMPIGVRLVMTLPFDAMSSGNGNEIRGDSRAREEAEEESEPPSPTNLQNQSNDSVDVDTEEEVDL